MNRPHGIIFPVLMCLLTVATAGVYVNSASRVSEYVFVIRTDEEGISRMRSDLADADLHGVEAGEVEEGLYRVKVRCPRGKVSSMLNVVSSFSEWRTNR